jgi:hypothetical protein
MARHYCTYFDQQYLTRGLAMYRSLHHWSEGLFTLWILCLDEYTHSTLGRLDLPDVRLIHRRDFEQANPELQPLKRERNRIDYYWSCTPALPLHVFKLESRAEAVTYLDADLLFFSSPEPVYRESDDASIVLVPHRFSDHADLEAVVGTYNVQMMVFRRDSNALEALEWWKARCLEWCSAEPADGRFGDQKYLDDWPSRFRNVRRLEHKGAGVAPWNVAQYALREENDGRVTVDREPVIFFHYHGFALLGDGIAIPNVHGYRMQRECLRIVYQPYLRALDAACKAVRSVEAEFASGYSTVSLRRVLRAVEQRDLLISANVAAAPGAVAQLLGHIEWPHLRQAARDTRGLVPRWLQRRGTQVLRACGYSRQ